MKTVIYYMSMFIMYITLTFGLSGYFGPEIKNYAMVVLILWTIQLAISNADGITTFLKALFFKKV